MEYTVTTNGVQAEKIVAFHRTGQSLTWSIKEACSLPSDAEQIMFHGEIFESGCRITYRSSFVERWNVTIVDEKRGYFCSTSEVSPAEGILIFDGKTLIDFDGVFELPRGVIQKLRDMGYDFEKFVLP